MDKFMESRWFMRIVGLLLAFILYLSVNFDDIQKTANNSNGNSPNAIETIQDVPLEVFYDMRIWKYQASGYGECDRGRLESHRPTY